RRIGAGEWGGARGVGFVGRGGGARTFIGLSRCSYLLVYVGATAYIGKQAQPWAAAMTVHTPVRMTKEAFLAWVDQREERYEYSGGRVIMMVRVTRNHSRVTSNLIAALKARLPSERYE